MLYVCMGVLRPRKAQESPETVPAEHVQESDPGLGLPLPPGSPELGDSEKLGDSPEGTQQATGRAQPPTSSGSLKVHRGVE